MARPTISRSLPKPIHREQLPRRGRIAVLEQINVFSKIFTVSGEPCVPRTREEVASQEHIRILSNILTSS